MGTSRIATFTLLAIVAAAAFVGAFFLWYVPPAPRLTGIGVKGVVREEMQQYDASIPTRVRDALIEVFDVESRELLGKATADAWGRYAVPIPRAASCRVRASRAPDFEREESDLRIDGAEDLDFALRRRTEIMSGVVETVSHQPVSGARVATEENPGEVATTDAEGRFTLSHVAKTDYRVRVEHASAPAVVFYPVAGGRRDVTLVLADANDQDPVAHLDANMPLIGRMAPPLAARFMLPEAPVPDPQGRVALLHFFAGYHLTSTRHLGALARAAAEKGFLFVPIHHAGAEEAGLTTFLGSMALGVPVLIDAPDAQAKLGSRTFARFGVSRLPTDIVLSSDGKVAAVLPAKATPEEILSAVAKAR